MAQDLCRPLLQVRSCDRESRLPHGDRDFVCALDFRVVNSRFCSLAATCSAESFVNTRPVKGAPNFFKPLPLSAARNLCVR